MLLGEEGRRRLELRQMTNDALFELYDADLVLRVHNQRNLATIRHLLAKFKGYLGGFPPTPELAKGFLSQYASMKPRTFYTYATAIKTFMKWYGEPMDDFKVKLPKSLPPYIEGSDIDRLYEAMGGKRTHKGTIERDQLLVYLARRLGLRRMELANLEVGHCHPDFIEVRGGKGGKDRTIELTDGISQRLQAFIAGKRPEEKVFGLKDVSIGNKITEFAKRAGVNLHTHSLRHACATRLAEKGANPRAIQQLLGHESLETTQQYISLARGATRQVVQLLEDDGAVHRGDGYHPDIAIPTSFPAAGGPPRHSWELVQHEQRAKRRLSPELEEALDRAEKVSPDDPRLRSY